MAPARSLQCSSPQCSSLQKHTCTGDSCSPRAGMVLHEV
ncbi:hypothetical protein Y717_03410 [Streptomyces scopuliridis RB72]|uniref:Uncharacterized protein n=1 Tax=Streptomyces scopuliridis RB72 TaxID=1440053 RepID=A0A2T7TB15_9ACTN|nr:hypothetical protein Y717_03410 [Streptomyces scopuliridis RB72]